MQAADCKGTPPALPRSRAHPFRTLPQFHLHYTGYVCFFAVCLSACSSQSLVTPLANPPPVLPSASATMPLAGICDKPSRISSSHTPHASNTGG